MRALLQRVSRASVSVDSAVVGHIGKGIVLLVGVAGSDTGDDARYVVEKSLNLRIFPDTEGRSNISALDCRAEVLVVSQFTLHADTRKGRRPSFHTAAPPEEAKALFNLVVDLCRKTGLNVVTGRFQTQMEVEIHNNGPVTIMVDSIDRHRPRSGTSKS